MALRLSPQMTVMQNAAQKAARRLLRDFGEVEQLQVCVKGPCDFVSPGRHPGGADAARGADPRPARLRLPDGGKRRQRGRRTGPGAGWSTRSMAPPTSCTASRTGASRSGWRSGCADGGTEIIAGVIYSPAVDEMFWAENGVGAFVNERRLRVSGRRDMKDALFATGIPFAAVSAARRLAFARRSAR